MDRRAVALGIVLFGVVLLFAPAVFWQPTTDTATALHVEAVDPSTAADPTPFRELPQSLQEAVATARQHAGVVALSDDSLDRLVHRHRYVSHAGTTYRLGSYRGEQSSLGFAVVAPVVVTVGATAVVVGWLVARRQRLRPLTPLRALLIPASVLTALWLSPSAGRVLGLPPAIGLVVPVGTLLIPTGSLCLRAGRRYVLLGPLVGLTAGVVTALALGADPARFDVVVASIAVVALPWYALGAILSQPR